MESYNPGPQYSSPEDTGYAFVSELRAEVRSADNIAILDGGPRVDPKRLEAISTEAARIAAQANAPGVRIEFND